MWGQKHKMSHNLCARPSEGWNTLQVVSCSETENPASSAEGLWDHLNCSFSFSPSLFFEPSVKEKMSSFWNESFSFAQWKPATRCAVLYFCPKWLAQSEEFLLRVILKSAKQNTFFCICPSLYLHESSSFSTTKLSRLSQKRNSQGWYFEAPNIVCNLYSLYPGELTILKTPGGSEIKLSLIALKNLSWCQTREDFDGSCCKKETQTNLRQKTTCIEMQNCTVNGSSKKRKSSKWSCPPSDHIVEVTRFLRNTSNRDCQKHRMNHWNTATGAD